ncbi:hypothetical protein D3C83_125720 [compost metagenome]
MLAGLRRALDLGMGGERPDPHDAVVHMDARKVAKPRDVDQQFGRRQTHVECGEQALSARKNLRAIAVPA